MPPDSNNISNAPPLGLKSEQILGIDKIENTNPNK